MASPVPTVDPPSLLRTTIRRSFVSGRLYLGIGIVISIVLAFAIGIAAGNGGSGILALLLPIYAVMGGMGGLMVFTSDRIKGVFEYLIAYGLSPQRLFLNVLISSLILVSVVLVVAVGSALLGLVLGGTAISVVLLADLGLYTVPMGLLSVAFTAMAGMYWTSLSSPREGMSSPIGLIPIVGVAPPLLALILAESIHRFAPYVIPVACLIALFVAVVILLSQLDRWLARERLLAPG